MNFKRSYSDGYFPTRITVLILWIYFFLLMLVYIIQWPFLHWEILIMLLSKFSLAFHHIHNEVPQFGIVYVIIWEMFHGRISLNAVLLLLLVNFVSGSGWNWCIYPSSRVSGQAWLISMVFSCLCCCHSSYKSLFSFVPNLLPNLSTKSKVNFRQASNRCKRFLRLPNLHMLIKQKSPSFPWNLALWTLGELLIVCSTKLNLLYLYSAAWRCWKLF